MNKYTIAIEETVVDEFEIAAENETEALRIAEDKFIIKEQHNCRATGYWKTNSVKYNFLLIAHEYLFVFKK